MIYRRQALAALAGLGATSAWSNTAKANARDGTLRIAMGENWEAIDPYFDGTRPGIILTRQVYDNLLTIEWSTGAFMPLLAKSYAWIDDLTLQFELRGDVLFHNGDKLTADDVVATFRFVMDPASNVLRRVFDWIKDVEKVDDFKVRFHLKYVYPTCLNWFATQLAVYSGRYLASASKMDLVGKPVGTGPFKVVEQAVGRSATLERFDKYRADSPKAKGNVKQLIATVIPDPSTQIAGLLSGSLDWIWHVSPDLVGRLSAMPTLKVESVETMRFSGIFFDVAGRAGKSPVQDQRVRVAIMSAIDRQGLRDHLVGANSRVLSAFCFPSQFGCTDDVRHYPYDPVAAKALLKEAGYEGGFDLTIQTACPRPETELVIANLARIGIRVNARFLEYPAVRAAMTAGTSQVAMLNWGSFSVNDVDATAGYFMDGGPIDMIRDPELMSWLTTAANTVDSAVRAEKYKLALQRIAERVYFIPLVSYVSNIAEAKQLSVPVNVDECPEFYNARWT